jgi:tellurite resistance protein TerC
MEPVTTAAAAAADEAAHVGIDPWLWPAFLAGVVLLILLDLFVFHKDDHEIKPREAVLTSLFWIALSLAFNAWFGWRYGGELGVQFLTGYLIEKSLSVDNLFVILLVFQSFRIPSVLQHRVLFWGILGAIVMRGIIILAGVQLVVRFNWILYFFGAILVYTAIKFLFESDEQEEVVEHWSVRLLGRVVPITKELHGHHFFVKPHGRLAGTPLLVALVVVEASDLVFAVDSIPAVFSVTQHPFVAFASNVLAILGLRSLYFVVADWVGKLRFLKPGLAAILGFVGVKMLIVKWVHIPSWVSLLVLSGILTTAALTSWYVARHPQED